MTKPLICTFPTAIFCAHWYKLSDPQCEARCVDRLSGRRFLGLSLVDPVLDETVLVRFRKRWLNARLAEPRFSAVLAQIEAAGVLVKRGTLIDAAIVRSARKAPPKGEAGGDLDARWAVKGKKPIAHGFKAHIAVDDGSEIVRAAVVDADAVYCDTARRKRLRAQGRFPRIRFNPRAGELTLRQRVLNHRWSKVRAKVGHVFADWKRRRRLEEKRLALHAAGHWAQAAAQVGAGRMSGRMGRCPPGEVKSMPKVTKIPLRYGLRSRAAKPSA
ncbi:MAG: transposase [Pseudomonadota bacterium]